VTNEDIKSEAAKFGNVALSITCKYHDSGLPNGSAFVHFDKKESADAFLDRLQTVVFILYFLLQ
jgi:RNA recognition motif-containing protein